MKKNRIVLFFMLLAGAVVGMLIGELTRGISFLSWLSYGQSFGISPDQPLRLELIFIRLQFGLTFQLSVSVILCMGIAGLIYRRYVRR